MPRGKAVTAYREQEQGRCTCDDCARQRAAALVRLGGKVETSAQRMARHAKAVANRRKSLGLPEVAW